MSELQVVQEMTRPPMSRIERYTRANPERGVESYTIAGILPNGSKTVLQPRADDPTRYWRNEIGDVIEMLPGSNRLVMQRGVLLNWSPDRENLIAGLDADPETGEVFDRDAILARLKDFFKAAAGAVVSATSAEAVLEPVVEAPAAKTK